MSSSLTSEIMDSSIQNLENVDVCGLLDLPVELRYMIFRRLLGSIVLYLRNLPQDDGYGRWQSSVEWTNPCPELLLVNRQIRDEALQVILQSCVLDLWGLNFYNSFFFKNLPKASIHIRHVAINFDRCEFTVRHVALANLCPTPCTFTRPSRASCRREPRSKQSPRPLRVRTRTDEF